MENTELLITAVTAALAIFSPLAIAWAKRESWSRLVRVAVPIIVSVVLAAVYIVLRGRLVLVTIEDYLNAFLVFYGLQQLAYTTLLRWWASILEKVGNTPADDEPARRELWKKSGVTTAIQGATDMPPKQGRHEA